MVYSSIIEVFGYAEGLAQSWGETTKRALRRAPLLRLVDVGLEGDLGGKLHGTSVVEELLLRPIEGCASSRLEAVASGVAGRVDIVNGSGDVLCVVEDVERLSAKLERIVLLHRDPLEGRKIKVVDRTDRKRITAPVRECALAGLDVGGVGVDGGVTHEVAVALRDA